MTHIQIHKRHELATPRLIKAQKPLQPIRIAPQRLPVKVMSSPIRILGARRGNS